MTCRALSRSAWRTTLRARSRALSRSTGSAGGRPRVADSPANAPAPLKRRHSPSRLRPAVAGWVERARGSLELAQELSYLPFQG